MPPRACARPRRFPVPLTPTAPPQSYDRIAASKAKRGRLLSSGVTGMATPPVPNIMDGDHARGIGLRHALLLCRSSSSCPSAAVLGAARKRLRPPERRRPAPQSGAVAAEPLGALPCAARDSEWGTAPERERRPDQATGRQHTAHFAQGSGVPQRIINGESFGPRRHQQRVIRRDKQGWRHPPLVHQALHHQGAGELDGVVGP